MKPFLWIFSAMFAISCSGVPGGDGVEDCVTSYSGSFDSANFSGLVSARLTFSNMLRFTFFSEGMEFPRDTMVDENGVVSGMTDDFTIAGQFNFDDCTASGTWEEQGGTVDWSIEIP